MYKSFGKLDMALKLDAELNGSGAIFKRKTILN